MKKIIFVFPSIIILFLACEKNPTSPDLINTSQLDGIAIYYTILYETENGGSATQLYLYNNGESNPLFDDDVFRSMICASPNGQTIAYLKNALLHPWFGYVQTDNPVISISDDCGKSTREIFTDSSSIVALNWLDNNTIIVSKYKDNKTLFTILDTQGNVQIERESPHLFYYYALNEKSRLFYYNIYEFGVYDIATDTWNTISAESEISSWQPPFYLDNTLILKLQNGGHISYNLTDNTYSYHNNSDADRQLLYQNSNNAIYTNADNYKNFSLYQNDTFVSTVDRGEYRYALSLFMTDDNAFYYQGSVGNDEGAFFKMDFDQKTVTKLTNHGINRFILNCSYHIY